MEHLLKKGVSPKTQDDIFEIPKELKDKIRVSPKDAVFDNTHLLEKGVSPKTPKNKPENSFDNTFVKSANQKKKIEKETIEKADMYEQMKLMIKQQLEEEEKNKKRKYDRKKPTSEKSVSEEYKQKLRDNLAKAREKRLNAFSEKAMAKTPLLEKDTFSEKVLSKTEEKPVEKPVEKHLLEKGVSPKIEEKLKDTFSEKVLPKIEEKPVEKLVSPKIEEVKPKVEEVKQQVIKFSTVKRPPWFKM